MAPDYILCHVDAKENLLQALRCALQQFYGTDPRESRSFGRIVNEENFNKAKDQLCRSGKVFIGGQVNEMERYIGEWKQCDIAGQYFIKMLMKSVVLMVMSYVFFFNYGYLYIPGFVCLFVYWFQTFFLLYKG